MDLGHLDETGFALTQPTTTTWGAVGQPRVVRQVLPQGRRLNVLGIRFTHGPLAGASTFFSLAKLPGPRKKDGKDGKAAERTLAERAAVEGLQEEEVGTLDSEVLVAFLWQAAGRPAGAGDEWRRERPLVIVLDNYSVHRSERVRLELRAWAAADIYLCYLPAYASELSRMEDVWRDVKYYDLPQRSYATLGALKAAVDTALARKAINLRLAYTANAQ